MVFLSIFAILLNIKILKSTLQMRRNLITLLLILIAFPVFSQKETNREALEQITVKQNREWKKAQKRAEKYAKENNIEMRVEMDDGTIIQLVDVVNGRPVFYKTDNSGAAITTRANTLWPGGVLGLNITGEGYDKVGIWDGGSVRVTHQEFNNTGSARVTQMDNPSSMSSHSTHVSGTIVAGGVNANAKGMAYLAELKTYDWNAVNGEMAQAAIDGMEISNHSWGVETGWSYSGGWNWLGDAAIAPLEDYNFGYYNSSSRTWDGIARNAPYFLMVKSAGNDRTEGPGYAGTGNYPEKDGGTDGYDCISAAGLAKNILTVGAVNEVLNYTGPSSVVVAYFSGWGPADDGRIKPDIVGNGVGVYSTSSGNNSAYETMDGTSMSAPNVTGTLVLLQQLYQQECGGSPMLSSTLKGLAIHTADECGTTEGPDYRFGWGLLNAQAAATVILENNSKNTMEEITLVEEQSYEREVSVSGNAPLKVTICWTDVIGPIQSPSLNNRTPSLVNDLDLRLVDESGNTYYPYKLNPDSPSAAATNDSKNNVDNVEHVYIAAPTAGDYTIIVDHEGTISGGEQVFSLIVSGIDEYSGLPGCSNGIITPEDGSETVLVNQEISWEPAIYASAYDVYFGTDGEGTSLPTNIMNGTLVAENKFTYELEPSTTYYLAIHPRNSTGANTECNTIYSFTTYAIDEPSYLEGAEDVTIPELPLCWQAYDNSTRNWKTTDAQAFAGVNSFMCRALDGQAGLMDNMLVSLPLPVQQGNEYLVRFNYRGFSASATESFRVVWGTYPTLERLTNEVYVKNDLNSNLWRTDEVVIAPDLDGYIFLGIHLNSESGKGIYFDDILFENWGPVGTNEISDEQIAIFYKSGKLFLNSIEQQTDLELTIMNVLGQQVLKTTLSDVQNESIDFNAVSGVYLVTVKNNNIEQTVKILVE